MSFGGSSSIEELSPTDQADQEQWSFELVQDLQQEIQKEQPEEFNLLLDESQVKKIVGTIADIEVADEHILSKWQASVLPQYGEHIIRVLPSKINNQSRNSESGKSKRTLSKVCVLTTAKMKRAYTFNFVFSFSKYVPPGTTMSERI